MQLKTIVASLCAILCAACATSPTASAWRAAAEADLDALRATLREDTPIAFDDENPRMQAWVEEGYRQAQARLPRVADHTSYFYALAPYINGFADPHLQLRATPSLSIARWPGFIATARGEGALVLFRDDADESAPPRGAVILECDGRSIAALKAETVFPFTLNAFLAGDQRTAAPRLFLDRGNIFAPPPRVCVFEEDGARVTRPLHWRDIPGDAYWAEFNIAALGPDAAFGVSAPADGVTWIGVPTFANEAADELRALAEAVAANAEAIRNGRAVVIDVRGNGGGNSAWGDALARALWGDAVVEAALAAKPASGAVDWRASPANLAYLQSFAPELIAQFGADSEVAVWINGALAGIEGAIASGEPFWRERIGEAAGPIAPGGGYTQRRPQGPSPIPARVYILSNGVCVSACMDFADIALHIPGVRLIGAATSGDGLLMEVRDQALPSGHARAVIPLKVYRGRARAALEAYAPDTAYDGIWTDEAVRAWVLELIAAQ
ncbi:MAG TPA: S41 family peptidase [Terricaulis sp.]|nr:S41 family peptidase [Terricaulis sp.]